MDKSQIIQQVYSLKDSFAGRNELIWEEWKSHLEVSNGIIWWGNKTSWDENEQDWGWVFPLTREATGEQLRASRRESTDHQNPWLAQKERSSDEPREGRKPLRSVRFGWSFHLLWCKWKEHKIMQDHMANMTTCLRYHWFHPMGSMHNALLCYFLN